MTPPIFDFLRTMAQMSIALIGFSAVVIALQHSRKQEANNFQHFISLMLVSMGGIILMFSLLPMAIHAYGVTALTSLRISGGILATGILVMTYAVMIKQRKAYMAARGRGYGALEYIRTGVITIFCLVLVISVANPNLIPLEPTYQSFISLLMVLSTLMFFTFVKWFGRKEAEE